ncbi:formylmethanofuran dehydrogenase [Azospirillum sp. SYSU D00513]|uniref:formylmethanofuran dehydrogenase n=1 Tax=Azospirillum sp. SYSU D00513 TaxID=2812561 RepID=UPI001A962534|nr:formylmethanofuran dehydrogenase [Azospirillum sp. SYSU D00513]
MALTKNAVCPFCGLGCDDIAIERTETGITPQPTGCPQADSLFQRSASPGSGPRVGGAPASLEEAVAAAARHLAGRRAPLIAGMQTDVAGVLAALSLADRIGATVDHRHSEGLFRNLAVLQRLGWTVTTFAEVRNRADLILVVGPDPVASYPRFWERWVAPAPALLPEGSRRQVVFLGGTPEPKTIDDLGGAPETVAEGAGINDSVTALRLALDGSGTEAFVDLGRRLLTARYAVVVWAAGMFGGEASDLTVESIVRLVRTVDTTTRCSGLPLSGTDNLAGANYACVWRTGFPLRTSFAGGLLSHDPDAMSWARRLPGSDAVLWISSFRHETPAADIARAKGPVVALATPETTFDKEPDVFIPVGTPGIDHAGDVFRSDSVLALHARALIDRGLPRAADVLDRIGASLTEAPAC